MYFNPLNVYWTLTLNYLLIPTIGVLHSLICSFHSNVSFFVCLFDIYLFILSSWADKYQCFLSAAASLFYCDCAIGLRNQQLHLRTGHAAPPPPNGQRRYRLQSPPILNWISFKQICLWRRQVAIILKQMNVVVIIIDVRWIPRKRHAQDVGMTMDPPKASTTDDCFITFSRGNYKVFCFDFFFKVQ